MTKNNIRIAENITKLRKEKNETQMQLAETIGVSNKTISKWETAESEPELSYIAAIAEHYKVSMDSLIRGDSFADSAYGSQNNLSYREAALKYFYYGIKSTFIFMENVGDSYNAVEKHEPLLPHTGVSYKGDEGSYTGAQTPEIFVHARSSREVNMLVTLMQNEDNYGWMERESDKLREIFALFAEPNVISLVRLIHTDGTSVRLTAEYASERTGCSAEIARRLFELMGVRKDVIEFDEGNKTVYTVCGNGYLLTAFAAIYEAFLDTTSDATRTLNADYKPIFDKK